MSDNQLLEQCKDRAKLLLKALKAGDKIKVTVTLFNKVENTADGPVFSDEITKVKENVTIT